MNGPCTKNDFAVKKGIRSRFMGCDIHLFVEQKNEDNVWIYNPELTYKPRAYDLFAKLAGVRNYYDITPISKQRGLPIDVTVEVKKELEFEIHSRSHLYLYELYESLDYYATWDEFVNKLFELSKSEKKDDVRIVFGFDN